MVEEAGVVPREDICGPAPREVDVVFRVQLPLVAAVNLRVGRHVDWGIPVNAAAASAASVVGVEGGELVSQDCTPRGCPHAPDQLQVQLTCRCDWGPKRGLVKQHEVAGVP